mgnify:FL=1|tara:strand:+ start:49 stop:291 length:243 start_codon:yes stop_codon:yes gene_type:complete
MRESKEGDPLTEAQEEMFLYIRRRVRSGMPPTVREIIHHFGMSSTNAARQQMMAIEKKGYIERAHGIARGTRITNRGQRL